MGSSLLVYVIYKGIGWLIALITAVVVIRRRYLAALGLYKKFPSMRRHFVFLKDDDERRGVK